MNRIQMALAVAATALGWGAFAADLRAPSRSAELAVEIDREADHMSAIELAERIQRDSSSLRVFDLRSPKEFAEFHIPSAKQSSVGELSRTEIPNDSTIVLYSEGGTHAAQAWVLMRLRGYRNVFFLREGIYEWISRIHEPRLAVDATQSEHEEFRKAEELSRYFGGVPQSGVPRNEVPVGYWNEKEKQSHDHAGAREAIANIRRRGC